MPEHSSSTVVVVILVYAFALVGLMAVVATVIDRTGLTVC